MNVLKGIDISPRYVGYARALVTAIAVAVIEAIIHFVTNTDLGGGVWPLIVPLIVLVGRSLEGELDQKQTPAQNVTPAPGDVVKVAIGDTPIATVPIAPPTDPPSTPPTAPAA